MEIPDFGSDLLSVAARTGLIYVFLVLALRLFGKREVGQLSTPDLVVLLILANGVQNAMVGQNTTLLGGGVAAVTVLALARAAQVVSARSKLAARVLVGEPRILARDGKIIDKALVDEEITNTELMAALREHGLDSIDEVRLVVLEVDGTISVIQTGSSEGASGGPGPRIAGHLPRRSRLGRRGRRS